MTFVELKKSTGMTLKEISDYFGVPLRTVENWSSGVNKCPDYLIELMRYKLEREGILKAE